MLGEVDVKPRRLDVTHDLVTLDPLQVTHRRDDVPVPELEVSVLDRQQPGTPEVDDPAADRIDRCAVRREMSIRKWNARDVPEMRGSLK